jgi:hypothetical protein
MQPETKSVADRILEMEAARYEEDKRLNSEREILLALAPDRWTELKEAFRAECERLTARSHRLQFECEEPDAQTFRINRMVGNFAVPAVDFTFDLRVPRIVYEVHWGRKSSGSIGFLVTGSNVLFANGTSGVILRDFLANLMIRIRGNKFHGRVSQSEFLHVLVFDCVDFQQRCPVERRNQELPFPTANALDIRHRESANQI